MRRESGPIGTGEDVCRITNAYVYITCDVVGICIWWRAISVALAGWLNRPLGRGPPSGTRSAQPLMVHCFRLTRLTHLVIETT